MIIVTLYYKTNESEDVNKVAFKRLEELNLPKNKIESTEEKKF